MKPRVLVVIATLGKRSDYLVLTLESIRKQTYPSVDIVLIYPLDSIETKKLAKKYGATSIKDPGSMSGAVNIGIKSASIEHKYVTWIGDDDLLEPNAIELSVIALEINTWAPASFGYCKYINENGAHIFTSKAGRLAPWLMTWGPNLVPLPGSMFRITALKKLSYVFDKHLKYAMDLDLFLRLRKIGPLVNVGVPVSSFRWHSTSTTVANRKASMLEAELVKKRNLNPLIQLLFPIWGLPVRFATHLAAARVAKISK